MLSSEDDPIAFDTLPTLKIVFTYAKHCNANHPFSGEADGN